jgi:hypothetical protein
MMNRSMRNGVLALALSTAAILVPVPKVSAQVPCDPSNQACMNCFAYYYGVYYQCLLSYPNSVGPAACQYIANWAGYYCTTSAATPYPTPPPGF